jgi:hypothetical protein
VYIPECLACTRTLEPDYQLVAPPVPDHFLRKLASRERKLGLDLPSSIASRGAGDRRRLTCLKMTFRSSSLLGRCGLGVSTFLLSVDDDAVLLVLEKPVLDALRALLLRQKHPATPHDTGVAEVFKLVESHLGLMTAVRVLHVDQLLVF